MRRSNEITLSHALRNTKSKTHPSILAWNTDSKIKKKKSTKQKTDSPFKSIFYLYSAIESLPSTKKLDNLWKEFRAPFTKGWPKADNINDWMIFALSFLLTVYYAKLCRLRKKTVCPPEIHNSNWRENKTSKQKFSGLHVKGSRWWLAVWGEALRDDKKGCLPCQAPYW